MPTPPSSLATLPDGKTALAMLSNTQPQLLATPTATDSRCDAIPKGFPGYRPSCQLLTSACSPGTSSAILGAEGRMDLYFQARREWPFDNGRRAVRESQEGGYADIGPTKLVCLYECCYREVHPTRGLHRARKGSAANNEIICRIHTRPGIRRVTPVAASHPRSVLPRYRPSCGQSSEQESGCPFLRVSRSGQASSTSSFEGYPWREKRWRSVPQTQKSFSMAVLVELRRLAVSSR
jgi:hypothetical protein